LFIWMVRVFLIIAGPLMCYFQVSRDIKGILIGLLGAGFIIGVEFLVGIIRLDTLVTAGIGVLLGYIASFLFGYGIFSTGNEKLVEIFGRYSMLFRLAFVALGLLVAVRKKEELDLLDRDILRSSSKNGQQHIKILDTSVIIDGRIADICATRFLAGPIIVPKFVLEEMHKLADSSDTKKRTRARRGLEILQRLQEDPEMVAQIYEKDYPELKDVDTKLVQLAKDTGGMVLTTDFNLNKIATLQGVVVLNVNDLANALKPIYLPNELISVYVVKEGKEKDQGIGYLDDGTMVVVEEGRKFIGRKMDVVVTSALQTSAGRMIFTRPR
jgi:uncharacterized protein YacL